MFDVIIIYSFVKDDLTRARNERCRLLSQWRMKNTPISTRCLKLHQFLSGQTLFADVSITNVLSIILISHNFYYLTTFYCISNHVSCLYHIKQNETQVSITPGGWHPVPSLTHKVSLYSVRYLYNVLVVKISF